MSATQSIKATSGQSGRPFARRSPSHVVHSPQELVAQCVACLPASQSTAQTAFSHPDLLCVTEAIASYLTHYLPFDLPPPNRPLRRIVQPSAQHSLLTACVSDALHAFRATLGNHQAYFSGLFRNLPRVAQWHAYSSRGKDADFWDFTKCSMSEWLLRTSTSQFVTSRAQFIDPPVASHLICAIAVSHAFGPDCFDAVGPDLLNLFPRCTNADASL